MIATGKCKINTVMLFKENYAINMSRLIPSLAQSFVRLHYNWVLTKGFNWYFAGYQKVHTHAFFCISTWQLMWSFPQRSIVSLVDSTTGFAFWTTPSLDDIFSDLVSYVVWDGDEMKAIPMQLHWICFHEIPMNHETIMHSSLRINWLKYLIYKGQPKSLDHPV